MKKKLKVNSKLIQGGIQLLKGKITGNKKDKILGISKILNGTVRKKVNRLLK